MGDHDLASFGDSYLNFVYSIATSNRKGRPEGRKAKGSMLAEALRRANMRELLPSRMSRHALADAVEALVVYSYLSGCVNMEEATKILGTGRDEIVALSHLLLTIRARLTFP